MSRVSLDDLKRIILEEAVSLSEADMSSSAEDFDSPAKLKKLRKVALASIETLPVDHPDLEDHVADLMMRLNNAATEEQLVGVHKAADDWHDRARQLMGWIHRGEYEESDDMTESRSDGSKRDSLKDVLAHLRSEDVVHAMHDTWDGGGEGAENLVDPVDQLKRQTGLVGETEQEFMSVAEEPNYPSLPLDTNESFSPMKSMAGGNYSPADHFTPRVPFSPMKSLVDVFLEAAVDVTVEEDIPVTSPGPKFISPQAFENELITLARNSYGPDKAWEEITKWLDGPEPNELLDAVLAQTVFTKEMVKEMLGDAESIGLAVAVDEKGNDKDPSRDLILGDAGQELSESCEDVTPYDRWSKIAGIINKN